MSLLLVVRSGPCFRGFLSIKRCELLRSVLEDQLLDLAGEAEGWTIVSIVHAGARVDADIERLVERHGEGDRARNSSRRDLGTVHFEDARAAFGKPCAGTAHSRLPGRTCTSCSHLRLVPA